MSQVELTFFFSTNIPGHHPGVMGMQEKTERSLRDIRESFYGLNRHSPSLEGWRRSRATWPWQSTTISPTSGKGPLFACSPFGKVLPRRGAKRAQTRGNDHQLKVRDPASALRKDDAEVMCTSRAAKTAGTRRICKHRKAGQV
jgi:hypothetical protein